MTGAFTHPQTIKRVLASYRARDTCDKLVDGSYVSASRQSKVLALTLTEVAEVPSPPAGVYDAVLPSTEVLIGMGLITVLSILACFVWANQVVPVSRTNLAISKSRGEVKEYLDELKASELNSDGASELSENTNSLDSENDGADTALLKTTPTNDRAFERWLFTDWLEDNKSKRRGGRQKDPAIPILRDAKWNSGDNPVLVASALIGVGVVVTSVTERLSEFL